MNLDSELNRHLHHHIRLMDWGNFIQEEANKLIAGLVAAIIAALLAFFKRVPKLIGVKRTVLDGVVIVDRGSEINNTVNHLGKYSGAIYIHIIRYHNGKSNRPGKPVYWDKMTVAWEETGRACQNCLTQCGNSKDIRPVQKEWEKIEITPDWRLKVLDKTRQLNGDIHTVTIEQMGRFHKSVFKSLGIKTYKEVYIKEKKGEMYTLGLSFCARFENYFEAEGMMMLAAKQLKNVL